MPLSIRVCAMTDAVVATAVTGRSLWADARTRLMRNRAAMVSLVYLAAMALVCIFGPLVAPNDFTTIHEDYTRVPPSLSAYPKAEGIEAALKDALRRARLDVVSWSQDGEMISARVRATKQIDPRSTYSTEPPAAGFRTATPQAEIDDEPVVDVLESYEGPATIETWTVMHERDGSVGRAHAVVRVPSGERAWAVSPDADLATALEDDDPIGWSVTIGADAEFTRS